MKKVIVMTTMMLALPAVALGGYKLGLKRAKTEYIDVPGLVQYIDVPGPVQYVDVPGPVQLYEVDVVVPGPVREKTVYVDRKIYVTKPRHCPSVADALNEYEVILRR